MAKPLPVNEVVPTGGSPGAGCLVRILWMMAGHVLLVLSAVFIAQNRGPFLSAADGVFAFALALSIVARYVDVTRLGGKTARGEPATVAQWRRYAILLALVAALLWAAAHAWSHFAIL